ncbi:MAG: hypothetical protein A3D16_12325 [Rhodobacterales bacterium RIFCSPHIGHO2_02_FULL_62_130]|nr:MAG: hypothetical protein A3D16_12325 [Rhodobacterales bacterium RIFCSPHIGHO2_02_FULL_62_130]OHC53884.1 MAG: hypothetical protein A3E48_23345 [Rhodobacterales bacterium RIFCSPHIGHO2_12_FULL_62_75]HCZ00140.1 hypothetical protein [Rhodobacter sp.]
MTAKPFCDGPFSILKGTNWIVGKDHHGDICHVLDQRGWGYLTGKGHSALGLDNVTASQMQADMQQWVVDALNAAWNRRADLAAVPAQAKGAKPLDLSDDLRGQLWQIVLKMTACDDEGCGQNNCSCMARYARILAAIDPAAIREAALRDAGYDTPAPRDEVTDAARDVLAERQRQINAEGWTQGHDDRHAVGELAGAAACYAMQAALDSIGDRRLSRTVKATIGELWPWSAQWWKPTTNRRDLIKAAALIIAEIERLDRAALAAAKSVQK